MYKKSIHFVAALVLTAALAACNNNAMDERRDDQAMNERNNRYHERGDSEISSLSTTIPSSRYPHTRAILIQDAKYQSVPVDPRNAADWQRWFAQPFVQERLPSAQHPNAAQPRQTQPRTTPQTPTRQPQAQAPAGVSQYAQQVVDLTNRERARAGLPALKMDVKLASVAQRKSEDMQQNRYFSHTSPRYGSPFDMMRDFGITYRTAGENIAQGQRTPQEVVTAWMNSPGHRANILNRQFTHIGVGFERAGNHWTQMFIGK